MGLGWHPMYDMENKSHVPNQPVKSPFDCCWAVIQLDVFFLGLLTNLHLCRVNWCKQSTPDGSLLATRAGE